MIKRSVDVGRQLRRALALLLGVTLAGAAGFYLVEWGHGWTVLDCLYMAVITVSTVGFTEVHPLSDAGRVFSVVLILVGVGSFTFVVTSMAYYLIAGELEGLWSQRRMDKQLAELAGHYIVCAYGRMGSQVADEFRREQRPVVVVDPRPDATQKAAEAGYLVVNGDAGNDDVLKKAGIERAQGLVTCIDNDAGNLMVVLTARTLNEKLFIVSRTNNHETTSKLMAAGANRVLWPYGLGGRRMAQMALRPNVVEFLELVMHDEELELLLEELKIALGSQLADVALGSADIRSRTGAMIVAVRQRTGRLIVAPPPETVFSAGDIAVALGTREQLGRLHEMAHGG